MLIAHMSDIHLGYSQFNLEEREEDVYNAFAQAVDVSIREGVKAVILAGDIFHTPKPEGSAIVRFGDQLKRLKERDIKVFFVLGEHDVSRVRGVPVPYVFHNLGYASYLKNGESYEFDNTLLIGFDKYRRGEIDDLNAKLKEADVRAQSFTGHKILVLHQGLLDFSNVAGEINSTDLPKNFTYYAMGHYHDRYEKRFYHLGGPLAYPGSIEITSSESIKETEKGFYIVDLSGKEASLNWVKLDIRPQFTAEVNYNDLAKEVDDVITRTKSYKKKPIVSVKVKGIDIDSAMIADNLSKLSNFVLHYVWEPIEEKQHALSTYDSKPRDIDMEMLRLTKEVLGSDELAEFAIKELLPLLVENKTEEAFEITWKAYQNSKFVPQKVELQ